MNVQQMTNITSLYILVKEWVQTQFKSEPNVEKPYIALHKDNSCPGATHTKITNEQGVCRQCRPYLTPPGFLLWVWKSHLITSQCVKGQRVSKVNAMCDV